MELIEGQIQNYDEFKNKIAELINTKRAQIIMEAQEEAYKEAVLNLEKEVNNQRQLAIDIEKKKQEIANETSAHERNNLTQDLREMEATYETKQGVIDGYYNTISDYELNSVRLASGNAEEIAKIETSVTASKATGISDRRTLLEQERASQEEYLNHLKEIYKGTNDELELQQIESAQKKLDATNAELQSMTSTINTGFPSILSAWGTGMSNAVNEVSAKAPFLKGAMSGNIDSATSGVSENGWKISDALRAVMTDGKKKVEDEKENFTTSGNWIMEGLKNGVNNGSRGVLGAIGGVASALVKRFNTEMGIASPSKVMASTAKWIPEGVSKGIKDNSKVAVSQMKGFAVQMIDTAKTTLKDGKLSDVFGAEIQGAADMINKINLGSKAAGILAGTNYNLSSGTSLGYIGGASQSMQKEYNFYQNNYSPKALSRFDIYRQSKNLLSQARRV